MKDFLIKLKNDKHDEIKRTKEMIQASEDVNEVRALGETLDSLKSELDELEAKIEEVEKEENGASEEERSFNPLATYGQNGGTPEMRNIDKNDTMEYREAFMNFVCRGVDMPAEVRADAITKTGDVGAVIPTSIMNEIVQKLESYGEVYSRVRKLNVQGGVAFPILSIKPTATWITADAGSSESSKQKIDANASVTFNYYGLECKISQTLLVNVTTIDAFQALFATLATEAIIKAIEIAIIAGSGSGQMTGITVDSRVPSGNKITMTPTEFTTWDGWKKKVFGKMAKAYRNGCFIMAQGTFDGYIDGMVDQNGQPIGRVNYGIADGEVYRFGGKEVLTVEDDVIANYDDAKTGDVVGVFVNLKDYAINSNMELKVVKWEDHDTNEIKNKAILICDGKLVDANGVIIIKKGAEG